MKRTEDRRQKTEDRGRRTEDKLVGGDEVDQNKPEARSSKLEAADSPPQSLRILVSGGGSGGHISPILAVVEVLRTSAKPVELLYVGESGGMEAKVAGGADIAFRGIMAGKFRRYHGRSWWQRLSDWQTLALNLRDVGRVIRGLWQGWQILGEWKPDVIFISGGYVGLPVGLAARWRRIPYVLHFADLEPGITRKLLAKHAAKIGTSFSVNKYRTYDQTKLVYTGNPVRRQIGQVSGEEGRRALKLPSDRPVVLVTGGSLGARQINRAVVAALPKLLQLAQVLHLTGEQEIDAVRFDVKRLGLPPSDLANYHAYPFLTGQMGAALAAADVVVSRAGANSIAELALLGKAVILIPAAHLHDQPSNALALSREGAALVLPEARLTADSLTEQIGQLLEDTAKREQLGQAIRKLAKPNAAEELAGLIWQLGSGGRR